MLRIWQQNLNKSLKAQHDMLGSLKPKKYDLALIQEPSIDFRNMLRTNHAFTSVYLTPHATSPERTQTLILVNALILFSTWNTIPIPSSDITAVELRTPAGVLRIINIYKDCEHNDTL
ncbi:hypothetical protein C8R45DRAFT_765308, partial [Mycena sanguinolenta]